jgi:MarR family 2-MHQ and catechol resistance regulon transcriptional repressor
MGGRPPPPVGRRVGVAGIVTPGYIRRRTIDENRMGTHYSGTAREVLALDTYIKLARALASVNGCAHPPLASEHGLTVGQLGVLETLLHLGPMPQTRLCNKLLMSGSNLTTVVDNLERHGWVRRERDPDDRRVQIVHLTAAGRATIEDIFPAHAGRITAALAPSPRGDRCTRELA